MRTGQRPIIPRKSGWIAQKKIKFQVVEKAKEYFKAHAQGGRVIDVDGIRINFKDGWGLIRASNTQPVLVLRFEAESEQRLREIQEFF